MRLITINFYFQSYICLITINFLPIAIKAIIIYILLIYYWNLFYIFQGQKVNSTKNYPYLSFIIIDSIFIIF